MGLDLPVRSFNSTDALDGLFLSQKGRIVSQKVNDVNNETTCSCAAKA